MISWKCFQKEQWWREKGQLFLLRSGYSTKHFCVSNCGLVENEGLCRCAVLQIRKSSCYQYWKHYLIMCHNKVLYFLSKSFFIFREIFFFFFLRNKFNKIHHTNSAAIIGINAESWTIIKYRDRLHICDCSWPHPSELFSDNAIQKYWYS